MNYTINKAHPEDAASLIEYLKIVGSETDNLTFGEEGLPFTVEQEESFIRSIYDSKDSIMIVAKDEKGNIIGNASINRLMRRMSHRGDIAVSVVKEHWNKGIGRQLLEILIKYAKENSYEIIELQVRSDNVNAIHLYKKLGFKRICTYPGFFKINNELIDVDFMQLLL